jgi:exopolysaccharide biosynthesis polyprenyl glycosylphosphotransferase
MTADVQVGLVEARPEIPGSLPRPTARTPQVGLPDSVREALPPTARRHEVATVVVDLVTAGSCSALLLAPSSPPPLHLLVSVLWVVLLSGARCYAPGPLPGGSGGLRRIVRAATALVALLALLPAVLPDLLAEPVEPTRLLQVGGCCAAVGLLQRSRQLSLPAGRRTARARAPRAVVVGHGRDVARVLAELAADRRPGLQVAAVCTPASSRTRFDVPVVRGFDLLPTAVTAQRAEVVVVLPCHHFDPVTLRRLGWQLESAGAHLVVASALLDVDRSRARTLRAGGMHLVHVRHAELTGFRRLLKQLWERPAAAVALVLLSPLLAVLALAIRLDSPGPAFFRQVRIGKDGQPFVMVKARTMTTDAEQRLGALTSDGGSLDALFKMRDDPRVTRLGRVLRRYSLDELPQLLNVVRGEMSLVGPRPALPEEVLQYDGDTLRRLAVRPGMTGLWQVSGRSDLPWDRTVRLDLSYVDNWSLSLDAAIVLRTLRAVLSHRGAY